MKGPWTFVKKAASGFLDYDTPKFVHIKSKKIGALCRITQLLVIGYVVGYDLIYLKGYQKFDIGISGITTKVKGTQYMSANAGPLGGTARIWDPADYVVPPQMNSAFFIMTNTLVTNNQSQGRCSEDPTIKNARCLRDSDCPPGKTLEVGNGAFTGICLKSSGNSSGVCEISSWCPIENSSLQGNATFNNAKTFTVLIKNFVFFPYYNKYRSNILENGTKQYLQNCTYNAVTDPQCPIFRIGDIVSSIRGESFDGMAQLGGIISIQINWDCDFDYDIKYCVPQYSFSRLDSGATAALVSQGYNFRYPYTYFENGSMKRTLVKAYGLLFIISCTATAGKFHVVPLFFSIGSGIGLLSIASVVCDFAVAYIDKKRHEVKEKKYDSLDDSSTEKVAKKSENTAL